LHGLVGYFEVNCYFLSELNGAAKFHFRISKLRTQLRFELSISKAHQLVLVDASLISIC